MRVGQFGGDVEMKVIVVRDDVVSELDHYTSGLLECLQKKYKLLIISCRDLT